MWCRAAVRRVAGFCHPPTASSPLAYIFLGLRGQYFYLYLYLYLYLFRYLSLWLRCWHGNIAHQIHYETRLIHLVRHPSTPAPSRPLPSLTVPPSNITTSGPSVTRRPFFEKSNTELTSSLRANFAAHHIDPSTANPPAAGPSYKAWTTQAGSTLYIPTNTPSLLTEPRESYDITAKLFYLPNIPASRRCTQTREAIELVLAELGVSSIDLLIVNFPGMSFDADDDDDDNEGDSDPDIVASPPPSTLDINDGGCVDSGAPPEDIDTILTTWRTLENLVSAGLVAKLGIAEFGVARLSKFLENSKIKPSVNQINVRDCCVVPKPLILYAKQQQIELLTHSDCTNILPSGTLRQILGSGEHGAGVLAAPGQQDGLQGDVEPQWVVKYTAVVKDRGVVQSKGYFAVAELREQ